MDSAAPLRIAIIGGGISGLTLAAALKRIAIAQNIVLDIYEAAPQFEEIGAGINLWPRVWEILKEIGLEDALTKLLPEDAVTDSTPSLVFEIRKSDHPNGVPIMDMIMNGGALRVHRADLQKELLKNIPEYCHVHLSKKLISCIETDERVNLKFQDGSTTSCDLLIAADGIKSTVRKLLIKQNELFSELESSLEPVWSGTVAYRGLVPVEMLEEEFPGHRASKVPIMHLIIYPVAQGRLINVVVFSSSPEKEGTIYDGPPMLQVSQEEILSVCDGWEEEVLSLLRCIHAPTKWAVYAINPLSRWTAGRITLTGDAAHAMTPHLGAGAGQAIEDAYVLAALIANNHKGREGIPRLLEVYNSVRQPIGNYVLEISRIQGMHCQFNAPGFEDVREGDEVELMKLKSLIKTLSRN
ncbi:salicylate hydroxylase [Crucibulum laeve]|uniref:Salicylate hydroxylase n=1 Tax=Crucibulum laeve TaxID=68775 RepID=A0A5C3LTQ7_9AGAR|nr:salicylate hydroxylase [Crucibulum laeve]